MKPRSILRLTLTVIITSLYVAFRMNSDTMRTYICDYLSYFMVALVVVFLLLSFCKKRMNSNYALVWIFVLAVLIPTLLFIPNSYEHEINLKVVGSLTGFVLAYAMDTIIIYIENRSMER